MTPQTETDLKVWPAPAKLNLFLHITGRRSDGYHELQTLFQILDWGDDLYLLVNDDGDISRASDIEGVPEERDICMRAAHLLKARTGVKQGVQIDLLKRIPVGAGLGGGSSDAATVLCALNELWACGLTRTELAGLGLELGADVPVFIYGHSALGEGRGEKLQNVSLGQRNYLLVFPDINISTADVFRQPSLKRNSTPLDLKRHGLQPGRNDCESVIYLMYPQLKNVVRDLSEWGQPHMSGTGSTFFLSFDDKKAAKRAARELECRYNVRPVEGVDRSKLLDKLSEEM